MAARPRPIERARAVPDTCQARACAPVADGPNAMPELVDRLHALVRDKDRVTIHAIAATIGAQGHAPLLMVAALLMILPVGMVPGVGGALGALVALIGVHMLIGRRSIWIPAILGRREIEADKVRRTAGRIRPAMVWLRRHLHIRMEHLARGHVSLRLVALFLIVSGGSLPILGAVPVATPFLGLPVAFFALGILSRDGAVVAVGYGLVGFVALLLWLFAIPAVA